MVKKLSIFIGVWLLSLFVFNSVTDGHNGLKSGSSNSPYFSSMSRGDGEWMTVKIPEKSYSSKTPSSTQDKTIYLAPISYPYSEFIQVDRHVLAYPPPNPIPYIERYPTTINSYAEGNVISSLDQKIFVLIEELNMVGLIVLFFVIRVFYTNWYQDTRLDFPPRWPF